MKTLLFTLRTNDESKYVKLCHGARKTQGDKSIKSINNLRFDSMTFYQKLWFNFIKFQGKFYFSSVIYVKHKFWTLWLKQQF